MVWSGLEGFYKSATLTTKSKLPHSNTLILYIHSFFGWDNWNLGLMPEGSLFLLTQNQQRTYRKKQVSKLNPALLSIYER